MTYLQLDRCTGPACPECGCQDVEILREPHPDANRKTWWGAGRAGCRHCGRKFSFHELSVASESESGTVPILEPVVESAPPAKTLPVVDYRTIQQPLCPDCGSGKVRVTHTHVTYRRYQCKGCKKRFKRLRESEPM